MGSFTVKVDGLIDLDRALGELSKPMARGVLRRVLTKAAKPIEETARTLAPKLTHHLEDSLTTGTKLNRRQRRIAKAEGKSFVEVYVGSADPAAIPQEFGTFKEGAQPFLRPAWDGGREAALATIKRELGDEIQRTAARAAKRQAARDAAGD